MRSAEETRPLGIPGCELGDDMKMGLRGMEWGGL
jgi:hypothetical protein